MPPAASTPRRSTPRRARSSSVASNTSRTSRSSSRAPTSRGRKKDSVSAAAAAAADRPALPEDRNPKLPAEPVPVKLQIIKRDGQDIIIGRVKLDTVNGSDHGFLLKRFDTDAVAASSMFRLAFPYADGEAENLEMAYLDRKYDTDRANGGLVATAQPKQQRTPRKKSASSDKDKPPSSASASASDKVLPEGSTGIRLQGTWIPSDDALVVAEEYGLSTYIAPLVAAKAAVVEGHVYFIDPATGEPDIPKNDTTPCKASSAAADKSAQAPGSNRKRQRRSTSTAPTTTAADGAVSAGEESGTEGSVADTPRATRTRTRRSVKANGTQETTVTSTTTTIEAAQGMTQKEIDEQIKKSRELAKEVQAKAEKATTSSSDAAATTTTTTDDAVAPVTRSRKRRASNERPSADLDTLADDDDDDSRPVNFVSRSFRRGTRAVRRRPVVASAGAMGAVAAAGVGALAWLAGGQVDVAQQLLQQGFTAVQGLFF